MRAVCGRYVIVYTRPIKDCDGRIDRDGRIEMPKPSMSATIEIISKFRSTTKDDVRAKALERDSTWATAIIVSNNQKAKLELETPDREDSENWDAKGSIISLRGSDEPESRLDKVLAWGLNTKDVGNHDVVFGIKSYVEKRIGKEDVFLGFQFIQLTLDCLRPEDFESDSQLVVAVKVPNDKDISSTELLRQFVRVPTKRGLIQDVEGQVFRRAPRMSKKIYQPIAWPRATNRENMAMEFGGDLNDKDSDITMLGG